MKNGTRNLNTLNAENMGRKLKEAIPRYHESTPSVVSEKNWNTTMMHAVTFYNIQSQVTPGQVNKS